MNKLKVFILIQCLLFCHGHWHLFNMVTLNKPFCYYDQVNMGKCVHYECCSQWDINNDYEILNECNKQNKVCCLNITCDPGQGCPNGYDEINYSCQDIDECNTPGICSGHKCNNTIGSYECECQDGFIVMDDLLKKCRHINESNISYFLFTEEFEISLMPFNETNGKNITILNTETVYPKSIDYSLSGNYMAWTDINQKVIFISQLNYQNPSKVKNVIRIKNSNNPQILSIDWIHDLIYWTDSETGAINVFSIHRPYGYYTLLTSGQPITDFKVNVVDSCLVWTNSKHKPRIMRSLQDGSNQTILYSSKNLKPFYIAIDIYLKRYYFIDNYIYEYIRHSDREYKLISIDFEGRDEKYIFKMSYLFHIPMIYHDDILLMSMYTTTLKIWDKFIALNNTHVYNEDKYNSSSKIFIGQNVIDMKIIDPILQPSLNNKCLDSNCSHICVPSDHSIVFRCLCPQNYNLINDSICVKNHSEDQVIQELHNKKIINKMDVIIELLNKISKHEKDDNKLSNRHWNKASNEMNGHDALRKLDVLIDLFNKSIKQELTNDKMSNEKHLINQSAEILIGQDIDKSLDDIFGILNKSTKITKSNISPLISNNKSIGEEVVLILILLSIVLLICLKLCTRINLLGTIYTKINARSNPLYEMSNSNFIDEMESNT